LFACAWHIRRFAQYTTLQHVLVQRSNLRFHTQFITIGLKTKLRQGDALCCDKDLESKNPRTTFFSPFQLFLNVQCDNIITEKFISKGSSSQPLMKGLMIVRLLVFLSPTQFLLSFVRITKLVLKKIRGVRALPISSIFERQFSRGALHKFQFPIQLLASKMIIYCRTTPLITDAWHLLEFWE
jgi:hypothetical protein